MNDFLDSPWPTAICAVLSVLLFGVLLFSALRQNRRPPSEVNVEVSALAAVAWLLVVAGVCGVGYFLFMFDSSVDVPGGPVLGIERVNNLGLMGERQNGIIVSVAAVVVGVLILLFRQRTAPPA